MKKFYYLLIPIILFTACSSTVIEQKPETIMWEISSDNAKVYLLGSIHLADDRIYPLHRAIESAFDSSQNLVLEIVIDEINPMTVMEYITFKDERTLESEVPKDVYQKISEMFEKTGVPKYLYNKFKPWFAVMMLQSGAFKDAGMTAGEGVDMYFLNKAREKGLKVLELESLEIQMKLMEELGEFTGEYLKEVIASTDSAESSINVLLEAWKTGDDKTIEKLSVEGNDKEEFTEVMEKLNYKRNEKMTNKIQEYLNGTGNYFVIVGAAHVVGERGIAELLKKTNKYNVKRF